jgi:hypothetical protein
MRATSSIYCITLFDSEHDQADWDYSRFYSDFLFHSCPNDERWAG